MAENEVKSLLREIEMLNYYYNFENQNIDSLCICNALTDADLTRLGLTTIGERVRFREGVRKSLADAGRANQNLPNLRTTAGEKSISDLHFYCQ
jgi:hypothetical protein